MKEINLRVIKDNKIIGCEKVGEAGWQLTSYDLNPPKFERWKLGVFPSSSSYIRSEYTGFDLGSKKVYEGDILREENEDNEIFYSVVTWIEEWCMFACLIIKNEINEYENYLQGGAGELDKSMFWTFPLIEEEHGKRYLAGNIYEHQNLLTGSNGDCKENKIENTKDRIIAIASAMAEQLKPVEDKIEKVIEWLTNKTEKEIDIDKVIQYLQSIK